jgi:hypothetical protein
MSPEYREGDFVVIAARPFPFRLEEGDVIVFHHVHYGTLIKRILRFAEDGSVYVTGAGADSLDSRRLGPIRREAIRGKVIWHIVKPT